MRRVFVRFFEESSARKKPFRDYLTFNNAYSIGFRQGEAFIGCDAVAGIALLDQIEDGIDLSKATQTTTTTTTTTTTMVIRVVKFSSGEYKIRKIFA